jgi:hypothetical protein
MDTDSGLEKKKMTELESMNHLFYHFMDESLKYALLGGTFGFLAGAVLKRPKFGLLFGTGFAYGKCVHKYSLQFAQFQETKQLQQIKKINYDTFLQKINTLQDYLKSKFTRS